MLGKLITILLVLIGLVALIAVGGYFALKRDDIPYATLEAKYETAASRYIDLPGGVRMHYQDQGADGAPTILLVHGYSASLHTWAPWVEQLGDDYRLVSIDLPGHGLTQAPAGYQANIENFRDAVHAFTTAYELENFAIAGSSMGGNVSWEYALEYPDDLQALILVAAAGWEDTAAQAVEEPPMFKMLRNPNLRPLMLQLDNTPMFERGLIASFSNDAFVTEEMVARYAELSRAPGHREALAQIMLGYNSRNYATPDRLAPITAPTLVLTGDEDELVPPAHANQFDEAIANSTLVVFEGVGHIPQEEVSAQSAQAVRDFLHPIFDAAALEAAAAP